MKLAQATMQAKPVTKVAMRVEANLERDPKKPQLRGREFFHVKTSVSVDRPRIPSASVGRPRIPSAPMEKNPQMQLFP
jgi:hypothetical protein